MEGRRWQLIAPTLTNEGLEVSVHGTPRILFRELSFVFPDIFNEDSKSSVLSILTCQKSNVDLLKVGEDVKLEKDRLLGVFMNWACTITEELIARGYWADYVDPCSGLPMRNLNGTVVYSEVDGMGLLLRYRSLNAAGCKILLHPEWGANVYPASLFTNAPLDVTREVLFNS